MAAFQPPPTWAELLLVDAKSGKADFNPIWLNWFISLTQNIGAGGPVSSVTGTLPISSSGGVNPAISLGTLLGAQQLTAGVGSGVGKLIGVVDAQVSSAGIGNGADTTDDTLFTYTLPLNSMSANSKSIRVRGWGKTAANANAKDVKLWFAGTAIADSGVLNLNNSAYTVEMEVTRIDATHVSAVGSWNDNGLTTGDVTVQANLVVSDLTTNNSVVKLTGASTVIGAANDVLGYGMKTWFEN